MNRKIKVLLLCLIVVASALLLTGCFGKSKSSSDQSLVATMQAQQATIEAMQGGAQKAPTEEQIDPGAKATMDAQQATITALQGAQDGQPDQSKEPEPADGSGDSQTNFDTDFSSDDGHFTLDKKMVIEEDGLYMGEFEKCADFSLEIDRPIGCIAICETCGIVSEYDERVEITYEDGYVDKMFGLVIRFNDENDNNMIDREDYFLGWAYNAYPQPNASYLFEHIPTDFAGWKVYGPFPRHLRGKQDKPSIIRIIAWNGGSRIIIYMNDTVVAKIQNEEKIPGKGDEIFLGKRKEISSKWEGMPNQGKVGFWVAEWKIKLKYDNFSFTTEVEEPEDW